MTYVFKDIRNRITPFGSQVPFIHAEEIRECVIDLAEKIKELYASLDVENPVLVCALKGAAPFHTALAQRLPSTCELEYILVSSYENQTKSSGTVRVLADVGNITGRHVLVVEDIADTRRTFSHVAQHLLTKDPASIHTCALLDKPDKKEVDFDVDFVGFVIPNYFVVGFGLDDNQRYRGLPYIIRKSS